MRLTTSEKETIVRKAFEAIVNKYDEPLTYNEDRAVENQLPEGIVKTEAKLREALAEFRRVAEQLDNAQDAFRKAIADMRGGKPLKTYMTSAVSNIASIEAAFDRDVHYSRKYLAYKILNLRMNIDRNAVHWFIKDELNMIDLKGKSKTDIVDYLIDKTERNLQKLLKKDVD